MGDVVSLPADTLTVVRTLLTEGEDEFHEAVRSMENEVVRMLTAAVQRGEPGAVERLEKQKASIERHRALMAWADRSLAEEIAKEPTETRQGGTTRNQVRIISGSRPPRPVKGVPPRDDDAALASVTERHFSAQAIARHFGISPDLVLAEQDRGEMAYVRFGKRRVVPESALLAYVRAHAFGDHPSRPLPPEPVKRGRGRRS